MDEGTLPRTIWAKASGNSPSTISSPPVTTVSATIPAAVKDTLKTQDLRGLYRHCRIGATHPIKCTKIPFNKQLVRLEKDIRKLVGDPLESQNLWFRGLILDALESTLAFFIPERNSRNCDSELGPGSYTADRLSHALPYARGGGAIMVWELNTEAWGSCVARWKHLPLEIAREPIPEEYYTADFIKGPISEDANGRRSQELPTPSDEIQLVACSYGGCKALSDSLEMIIFIAQN
ncbi:unnamed protein product [Penicillium glandicola]